MRQILLLSGFMLPLFGCATELHVIKPIPRFATSAGPAAAGGSGGGIAGFFRKLFGLGGHQGEGRSRAATASQTTIRPKEPGVWLVRSMYDTKGFIYRVRTLRSIEILFCPMKKNDFSDCRQGIGWSSNHQALAMEYPPEPARVPSASEPAAVAAPPDEAVQRPDSAAAAGAPPPVSPAPPASAAPPAPPAAVQANQAATPGAGESAAAEESKKKRKHKKK